MNKIREETILERICGWGEIEIFQLGGAGFDGSLAWRMRN
jgi:hypothetical protein